MKTRLFLALALAGLLRSTPALAQQPATTDTTRTATPTAETDPKPEFFGYVGVYYGYDFNNPADLRRPGFIYSENLHNQIAINIALLGARYQSERVRGTFAIQTGTYPDANYAAEPQIFKNIYEAWGGVKLAKNLWLDAGIFLSHIGLEGPISRDDLTLTRSIMADNSPYYEAGAKLTYDNGQKWLFSALVLNGWQVIRDNNQNMAVGTQVQFRPNSKWLLNSSTYLGEGRNVPDSVDQRTRYYHDFYLTFNPSEKWRLAAAVDAGWQEKADGRAGYDHWHAGSLIVRRRLGKKTGLVGRAEYFHDPAAVVASTAVGGLHTGGYSLGFDYNPVPRVILRLEGKQFRAADAVFTQRKELRATNAALTGLLGLTF
ncbi:Putative beta-barrel porin-2, OmpL-like. bbp2 [Hymenobacter daecheongensis DSM 21074]|uniref:Putative beta-barrel porin-2, OmpL-like. bbp2 n=1 Tax=Hymenobacter daecheongensis DSM 21074 TaxID=1121955 RepID=A0A1M6D877_9BACT|nr:porin [Hymenobacter daecheongensis]SHI69437.1 Putative beta-barrel porin-2, OmpL-like. bbp2 [Hymenobacter daecheongensis DSM 21074]